MPSDMAGFPSNRVAPKQPDMAGFYALQGLDPQPDMGGFPTDVTIGCIEGPVWSQSIMPSRRPGAGGIVAGGGVFVAALVTVSGVVSGEMMYSPDGGLSWSIASPLGPTLAAGNSIGAVAYGNGRFWVAWASNVQQSLISFDGVFYAATSSNPSIGLFTTNAMWFGNGLFLAAASSAFVVVTPSGSNGVSRATPVAFSCGVWVPGISMHLAGAAGASSTIYASRDTVNWSVRGTTTFPASSTLKIACDGGVTLVALDRANQRNFVSYSLDGGITWNSSTGLPTPNVFYRDVMYAGGLFIIVDQNARVYFSLNGGASFTAASSDLNSISSTDAWLMAYAGAGKYAAVHQSAAPTTTAASGIC